MLFPAHIRYDDKGEKAVQTVLEHCAAVAEYAGQSLEPAGLVRSGYLAGLLHDMGKEQKQFADYIESAAAGKSVRRGSVIHTFQGCRYLLETEHCSDRNPGFKDLTAEIIAYAVGAHHGLFDCVGLQKKEHGLAHRVNIQDDLYEEARDTFLKEWEQGDKVIKKLFGEAEQECIESFGKIQKMAALHQEKMIQEGLSLETVSKKISREICFYLGMETRLLLSAVIEGDRRDTAHFMHDKEYPVFGNESEADVFSFWEKYLKNAEQKIDMFPKETSIQRARGSISELCRAFAEKKTGIYRLNVPTGAGKTLSSLRYALAHAAIHKKRRIIFTAPLLSIIDQNAQIIRDCIGDDSIILEHHTNIGDDLAENAKNRQGDEGYSDAKSDERSVEERLKREELLAESWNAPVIITSMVQLLQTLFSGKTASIRRMQALCGSVIVIDEVQAVPEKMLSLFNLAVNYLSELCDVTFLLCSATQPCLEETDYPLLYEPEDVVPFNEDLWTPFHRTCIHKLPDMSLKEMAEYILEEYVETNSLLVVCNKKAEAEYLYRQLKERVEKCFHLSASMCMSHRKEVLRDIMDSLEDSRNGGSRVVCVTTQVIEAGVDISFGCVIRFMAGMDSVVQAAGRCNRNGEKKEAPVYIVNCKGERLSNLKEIENGKRATNDLVCVYQSDPQRFDNDLSSDSSIREYYRRLYRGMPAGYQDYTLDSKKGLKAGTSILSLLSDNSEYCYFEDDSYGQYMLNQAFASAGSFFQVFDGRTVDAVCPYGAGKDLILELEEMEDAGYIPFSWMEDWMKRVKPYTISLYDYQILKLEEEGGLHDMNGVLVLHEGHYDQDIGLAMGAEENFII